jgi:hypothetical protein
LGTHDILINASYPGGIAPFYTNGSRAVTLTVLPRGATLTVEKQSNVQFGENITILVTYQDSVNSTYIDIPVGNISVSVNGYTNLSIAGTGSSGTYEFIIQTNNLDTYGDITVNVSTSWVGAPFYYNRSKTIQVTVSQRSSILTVGSDVYEEKDYGAPFNVTLDFIDVLNGSDITDATNLEFNVSASFLGSPIDGVNASSTTIVYTGTNWEAEFDSTQFGEPREDPYDVTVSFLWLAAAKPFYVNQTVSFEIIIQDARTQIITSGSFTEQAGVLHNVSFRYISSETGQGIENSTITLESRPDYNDTFVGDGVDTGNVFTKNTYTIWDGNYDAGNGWYNFTFDLEGQDNVPFNISFARTNFTTVRYSFTLIRTQLSAEVIVHSVDQQKVPGQNVTINIRFEYKQNGQLIPDATARLATDVDISGNLINGSEYDFNNNVTVNATEMVQVILNNTALGSGGTYSAVGFHQVYIDRERAIRAQVHYCQPDKHPGR